jgi:hypothetical protein
MCHSHAERARLVLVREAQGTTRDGGPGLLASPSKKTAWFARGICDHESPRRSVRETFCNTGAGTGNIGFSDVDPSTTDPFYGSDVVKRLISLYFEIAASIWERCVDLLGLLEEIAIECGLPTCPGVTPPQHPGVRYDVRWLRIVGTRGRRDSLISIAFVYATEDPC